MKIICFKCQHEIFIMNSKRVSCVKNYLWIAFTYFNMFFHQFLSLLNRQEIPIPCFDKWIHQNIKSASSRNPSVEYDLNRIPEFPITFSTSFADSSLARSAIHLHFGSTLKNEKLK